MVLAVNNDSPNVPSRPEPYPRVYPWDTGPFVAELQELLSAHGYPLKSDGEYGWRTEAAVRAFQREHRLRVDGMVGPETWAMLTTAVKAGIRTLRQGHRGRDVRDLQGLLQVHNFMVHRNGFFDDQTQQAVNTFKKRHNLRTDGTVCPVTWTLLRAGKPNPAAVKTHPGWLRSLHKWW
ncbi:peptidoglycan-binding protein [Leptolyngbya sp. FACHB-16]|nr:MULTISPECIES: peptidoglycan-binding protein [unclassified Leptolyngbya]MBD1912517.1 peptidoglycan-binding protein [Leptolyngbya sp. FACHB-8]MBD2156472.1 peptidoglycan-binding protein [Leptolyngbya sp. FACHB-16]